MRCYVILKKKLIVGTVITPLLLILVFFLGKEKVVKEDEGSKQFIDEQTKVEEQLKMESYPPFIDSTETNKRPLLKYRSDDFQGGMNIQIYGHPDMEEVRNVFNHLRNIGINSVALNFPFYQSNWQANEVSTSPEDTPTITELQKIIEIAHSTELSVMIKPIMDEQVFSSSNMWRGQIKPTDPDSWFESYHAFILTYAKLAESTNAKSLNIGTELNSMQSNFQDKWKELIESVRQVYKGRLLYSFNYDTVSEIPSIEFVKLLDYVGIDAYFPLDLPNGATVKMLEEEWRNQMMQLESALWQYSLIVTEAGILPIAGAYRTPYAWSFPDGTFDSQAQSNYYEATFNIWKPKTEGIYWWAVILGDRSNDITYSPLELPAEEVLKKHLLQTPY